MFNNRFNSSKNDPLIEAVKAAQHDGECRRQAEKIVNEEFGVYSRKAVVREQLAAYDAALEEVYANLKEGDNPPAPVGQTQNIMDPNSDFQKNLPPEVKKVFDAPTEPVNHLLAKEEKKLAKKDCYEESDGLPPSDAAKQAGAAQQAQTPSSTPKRTGNAAGSTISNARDAAGMNEEQLDELKKPTAKTAKDAYHRAYDSDVQSGGEGRRTARLGRWMQKNLPDKSARNQKEEQGF